MVVSVVNICSRTILQSTINNSCNDFILRKITIAKYELRLLTIHRDKILEQILITWTTSSDHSTLTTICQPR